MSRCREIASAGRRLYPKRVKFLRRRTNPEEVDFHEVVAFLHKQGATKAAPNFWPDQSHV